MTHPYTVLKKCRFIDEVITPWPCFVIAACDEIISKDSGIVQRISQIVNERTQIVKNSEHIVEVISRRYNLRLNQVQHWLSETDWNYIMYLSSG